MTIVTLLLHCLTLVIKVKEYWQGQGNVAFNCCVTCLKMLLNCAIIYAGGPPEKKWQRCNHIWSIFKFSLF